MISFYFPDSLIQGFYFLEVFVENLGLAGGSFVLESVIKFDSVTPNTASRGG